MSKYSRDKGIAAEKEVTYIFRDHGWPRARRTSDGRVQIGRGDIADGPAGCHVEVKRHERLNVPAALRQIEADADPLDIPILVHRPRCRHGRRPVDEWMATIPLVELLPLLRLREQS